MKQMLAVCWCAYSFAFQTEKRHSRMRQLYVHSRWRDTTRCAWSSQEVGNGDETKRKKKHIERYAPWMWCDWSEEREKERNERKQQQINLWIRNDKHLLNLCVYITTALFAAAAIADCCSVFGIVVGRSIDSCKHSFRFIRRNVSISCVCVCSFHSLWRMNRRSAIHKLTVRSCLSFLVCIQKLTISSRSYCMYAFECVCSCEQCLFRPNWRSFTLRTREQRNTVNWICTPIFVEQTIQCQMIWKQSTIKTVTIDKVNKWKSSKFTIESNLIFFDSNISVYWATIQIGGRSSIDGWWHHIERNEKAKTIAKASTASKVHFCVNDRMI